MGRGRMPRSRVIRNFLTAMTTSRRILLGAAICLVGIVLAWRSLHRADSLSVATSPVAPHVEQALGETNGNLVLATEDNVHSLVESARNSGLSAAQFDAIPTEFTGSSSHVDLADAFASRLASYLMLDFDRSYDDMVDRGWPQPSDATREAQKRKWVERKNSSNNIEVDPSDVSLASLASSSFSDPRAAPLDGYGRSCFKATPPDADEQTKERLSQVGEGIVELRIRARVPNIEGHSIPVFLGFQFTWDIQLHRWRWVQTCVYRRPSDLPAAFIPPI